MDDSTNSAELTPTRAQAAAIGVFRQAVAVLVDQVKHPTFDLLEIHCCLLDATESFQAVLKTLEVNGGDENENENDINQ